jgi:hypothetical protein
METRIAKKSRFQIVKLEERVAPAALASATAYAFARGPHVSLSSTTTSATAVTTRFENYAASYSSSYAASS